MYRLGLEDVDGFQSLEQVTAIWKDSQMIEAKVSHLPF